MTYDAIVIGAGPAGYVCAIRCAQLGLKTAVVEKENFGGVCLNVGCIPSKALIAASKLVHKIQTAEVMGIKAKYEGLDVDALVSWKAGIVNKLTSGVGVHLIGPEVTELIAEGALAIEMGATVGDLAATIHAHPTLPEAMMEAAEAVHSMAVHIFQKPTKK